MILFLVTHFHSGDRVAAFIDQVASLDPDGTSASIAVVDNSPDEPFVHTPSANVAVYRAPTNLGYLNGCAFGRESWLAEGRQNPQITAVSNTDISLDAEFIRAVTDLELEQVGVVAPDVRLPDGTRQNPFMVRRPSRVRLWGYRLMFTNAASTLLLRRLERVKLARRKPTKRPSEIYAAHGSIFLLTNTFFARGGTLEFGGFMSGEEIHIAEQARRHELRTVMAPTLRARHERHASTGNVAARKYRRWHRESLRAILRDYY